MISLPMALPFVVLASAVSTPLECGFGPCPDNPTGYELLVR